MIWMALFCAIASFAEGKTKNPADCGANIGYELFKNGTKTSLGCDINGISIAEDGCYFKQEGYEMALQHYLSALSMAKSIDDYRQLSTVCREIAELYAAIEDYKNAYDYQNLHHQFEEQYLEQVNMRQQMELQIKYEAEKLPPHSQELKKKKKSSRLRPEIICRR